ncbi:hypothetical protein CMI37_39170 [Candidatus Pacearchaeota archaeon]|nr:hypothetical protein [Candidatus Pacearchaeota archaeon]
MKNITLTITGTGREVMVNWNNVEFAKVSKSPYGDDYVEVHFGDQHIDVKETLQEIHEKCLNALV